MISQVPRNPELLPRFETEAALNEHIQNRYGPEVLVALRDSIRNQKGAVDRLKAAGLNGQSVEMSREYLQRVQEFDRASRFMGNESPQPSQEQAAPEKKSGAWELTKKVIGAPFRFMARHPILTTLGLTALAYYSGAGAGWFKEGQREVAAEPDLATGERIGDFTNKVEANPGDIAPTVNPQKGVEQIGDGAMPDGEYILPKYRTPSYNPSPDPGPPLT